MLNDQFLAILPVNERNINSEIQLTVDARQLHTALQVSRDFSRWFPSSVLEAQLDKDIDYIHVLEQPELSLSEKSETEQVMQYYLTLDAAKGIAMLERNSIGKQVRKYLIEAGKVCRLNNPEMVIEKSKDFEHFSLTDRITAANAILSKLYVDNQLVLALDKLYTRLTGVSVLE